MTTIRELARAKVNLTLAVRGRRADGYHELETLVTFADVGDVLTVTPGDGDTLAVSGPFAPSIVGENLLTRAIALVRKADPGLRIGAVHLEKHLPVAAGLGGGSADAAALLRALLRANKRERADSVPWMEIAARLGADVPMCLGARPAMARGRGERLDPVERLPALHAVLVNPGMPLATPAVFAALGCSKPPPPAPTQAPPGFADLPALLDRMRTAGNDLEAPAVALLPAIGEVKERLRSRPDCRYAAMSGSGPTCFGIFSSAESARRAAVAIAAANPDWWVAPTRLAGTSGRPADEAAGAAP
jgi:4-diphosphocytidyl-2-C-methyl-D-erythritol kinase